MSHLEQINKIAEICAHKEVQNVIISPGSRSAPLTVAFARHPDICTRIVYDERAAAYIAMGLAQQSRRPVGLVCTSGTAVLNYAPAVVEAHYQQIPLLLFTADRPAEWIDQRDNQTIHQRGIYGPHCRASFELPVDTTHPDAQWHLERTISEAINKAQWPIAGPVHLNVPLREPLYPSKVTSSLLAPPTQAGMLAPPTQAEMLAQPNSSAIKIIQNLPVQPHLSQNSWDALINSWQQAKRKLIIVGMHQPDIQLCDALRQLSQEPTVAVIADITSNIYPDGTNLYHSDMILGTRQEKTLEQLKPDLLISLGGQMVSKYLKLWLRKARPQIHWHIEPAGDAIDTYQSLTHVIPVEAPYFCTTLNKLNHSARTSIPSPSRGPRSATSYAALWHQLEEQARRLIKPFLEQAPFGEFQAIYRIMQQLPAHSRLQLGNSSIIRYANFISQLPNMTLNGINSNRGTSGIDGTVSTTVGAALATNDLTTLITGDLAFFYDRNALWHDHLPANLRLIVLNNHGGGIFKLINGPNQLTNSERDTYFFTPQPLTARRTAADHHCDYIHCDNAQTLQQVLPDFFAPQQRAAILEIETDADVNSKLFWQFKQELATLG